MHHAPTDFSHTGILFNGDIAMSGSGSRTDARHTEEQEKE
jgi:hypothetical protein